MPHNVDAVIKDIEDLKGDLHRNLKRGTEGAMGAVEADAKANVEADAEWKGNLRRGISLDVTDLGDQIIVKVQTDRHLAPYAPFVEFGTGARSTRTLGFSRRTSAPDEGTRMPPDFPYDSPGLGPGMVQSIIDWVETKPIVPTDSDMTQEQLGFAIAATIAERGTYAHPFLRPAWFDNEEFVKQATKNTVIKTFQ